MAKPIITPALLTLRATGWELHESDNTWARGDIPAGQIEDRLRYACAIVAGSEDRSLIEVCAALGMCVAAEYHYVLAASMAKHSPEAAKDETISARTLLTMAGVSSERWEATG